MPVPVHALVNSQYLGKVPAQHTSVRTGVKSLLTFWLCVAQALAPRGLHAQDTHMQLQLISAANAT